jgi:PleD family two-component response regulator
VCDGDGAGDQQRFVSGYRRLVRDRLHAGWAERQWFLQRPRLTRLLNVADSAVRQGSPLPGAGVARGERARTKEVDDDLRVLIIEDSEDDALLLLRALQRGGYAPTYTRVDTPAALQAALDREDWDIVISDYSMPHFSGLGALTLVKERGLDLPFLLVSGTIGEESAVAAMRAGAHDYLMKDNLARLAPAVARELHEAEERLARRQAEEQLREAEARYRTLVEHIPAITTSPRPTRPATALCQPADRNDPWVLAGYDG